jgi:hypothetical protein
MTTMAKELVDAGRITARRSRTAPVRREGETCGGDRRAAERGGGRIRGEDYYPLGDEVILIADALGGPCRRDVSRSKSASS